MAVHRPKTPSNRAGYSVLLVDLPAHGADAVVLEAVYPTIEEAIADRPRIWLGPPGPSLAPLLTWQVRLQTGVIVAELRPIDRVGPLRVPLMVMAGEADRHTTTAESRRLFAAAPEPRTLWVVPRAPHGDLYASDSAGHERNFLPFLERYLRTTRRLTEHGQVAPFGWVMGALPFVAHLWARFPFGGDAISYGFLVAVVVGAPVARGRWRCREPHAKSSWIT